MKSITMFLTSWCPHCKRAINWMNELTAENPNYKALDIKLIDEDLHPEISNQYDYYYVPTYYIENEKVHEGAATKEIIKDIFEKSMV